MTRRISELCELKNIGAKTEQWLNEIGVYTRNELEAMGPVNAYHILRQRGRPVSLNLVYAIQGAVLNLDWRSLPPELKAELRPRCRR